MRIGVEMLGEQSAGSHGGGQPRGVGRYTLELIEALLKHGSVRQLVLYYHVGMAHRQPPSSPRVTLRTLASNSLQRSKAEALDELVRINPDRLDTLLITSPLDLTPGFCPPRAPVDGGVRLAAIFYDLIPALFQESYLSCPDTADRYYRALRRLRSYDALLTISEATRRDVLRVMGPEPHRVVTIGAASRPGFFRPSAGHEPSRAECNQLATLGIDGPFIFNLGGMDDRKNLTTLLRAFQLLPASVRDSHQLVVTCAMTESEVTTVQRQAREIGVHERLVLTNATADTRLRLLYQRCAAFAFPSIYEGFGLPILEALHCGAPVVAGNNSSQPEVVGRAGLLAQANDAADIARQLERILTNPAEAAWLRRAGPVQAAGFSWSKTADRACQALTPPQQLSPRQLPRQRMARPIDTRPRIAFFAPLPPKRSGISDYSMSLLNELKSHFIIDLYHEPGYEPEPGLARGEFACRDYRLFKRFDHALQYHEVVYQMGNSSYHRFIYETLQRRGGVVTLHDFALTGFQFWMGQQADTPPDYFDREIAYSEPQGAEDYRNSTDEWGAEEGGLIRACIRRGIYMNRRVLEHGSRIVLHDTWGLRKLQQQHPEYVSKTAVIPLGTRAYTPSREEQLRVRTQFGLPHNALLIGCFGILHSTKMCVEVIESFHQLADELPHAMLLFAGQEKGFVEARTRVAELELGSRVRFLGHQPLDTFFQLAGATDIAVNLRRPPTNGETSASLLMLLGCGTPTIVNDVDTFASFPADVVSRIGWDAFGKFQLTAAMRALAVDAPRREQLGKRALEYVRRRHSWSQVAELYALLIDDAAKQRQQRNRQEVTRRAFSAPEAA